MPIVTFHCSRAQANPHPHPAPQLIAAPGKAAGLLATLSRAQAYAESDAEPGCLQYRISVDPKDSHKVCVFEVYVSRARRRRPHLE